MVTMHLDIQGMHCASCAMLIDEELEELRGVSRASTSYARQRTEVEYDDSTVATADIIATITELGYQAHPAD